MRSLIAYWLVSWLGILLIASFLRIWLDHPILRAIGLKAHEPNAIIAGCEVAAGVIILFFGIERTVSWIRKK